jgi:ABC-type glycerol-3-phosphate transport system substrate-binding protein
MADLYQRYSIWGLPMSLSFPMMFYRADVFHELGISPPETWEELHGVASHLAGNNMEVGMPGGMGGFWTFLHQYGENVFTDNGRAINFENNTVLSAWESMCVFFQRHLFPVDFDSQNRFRSGEMPLVIADYTFYTTLAVFAPQIRGLWEFVPIPGVRQPDGTVNNVAVAGVSAVIMLRGAVDRGNQDAAWQFMRWFVGERNQANYASEMTALVGAPARHNTANINALHELPWTANELRNLQLQMNNLTAVREYPGSYILERYVRFAFDAVTTQNAPPSDALLLNVVAINRELSRRRAEFNMAYFTVGQR